MASDLSAIPSAFSTDEAPFTDVHPLVRDFETRVGGLALVGAARVGGVVSGPILRHLLDRVSRRHPRAFGALRELRPATVVIAPDDKPVAIVLTVGPDMDIAVRSSQSASLAPDARIAGPLAVLIDLLEGRVDGDALFFRRELTIEGDTALVVALRNAFDGEDMDLVAAVAEALPSPLSMAARGLPGLRRLGARLLPVMARGGR